MRKTIVVILVIATALAFTSCASSYSSRSGCKMSQGYVGYR
ncbi:hypothetical protein [Puia dinghuensis]|nr:hypothetical protein [Puia dinghuensis]